MSEYARILIWESAISDNFLNNSDCCDGFKNTRTREWHFLSLVADEILEGIDDDEDDDDDEEEDDEGGNNHQN